MLDDLDQKILNAMVADSSTSVSRMARRFKVARSTVQARLERMETNGTIAGYTIKLGDVMQARRVRATVLIEIEPRSSAGVVTKLKAIPEVEMVATSTGRVDLIAQIACGSTEEIDDTLERITALSGVTDIESLIHLSTKFDRSV
ncbi:Lrp/AsnC family transcriptional regulator [Celeribacter sp.]|uniref:Lrp/AsnC family transcriptional regulator n=1 Tax=Celeribacter sp. TaxID=1890673 RepID=UPI003A925990